METNLASGKSKYPTQAGRVYVLRYGKKNQLLSKEPIGFMLLPNGFHAQKCEDTLRRRFPMGNAFRAYDQNGSIFFCGSL